MPNWMNWREAMAYFGVDEPELERIVLEHDVDIETDDNGNIRLVDSRDIKEVLFKEYEKKAGHRPDDPKAMHAARVKRDEQEKEARRHSRMSRERLRAKRAGLS